MLYNAREETIHISGSSVTCAVFGKGTKPLVIIPGLSLRSVHGNALPLAWMYRIFCDEYRVYVIDRKEDLPETCTACGLADDVAEVMQQAGIGKADVIGISQGGMIAQYLALEHPELVSRLVLGVTLSRPNETVTAAVNKWIGHAEKGDIGPIIVDMMENMYSEQYVRKYRWLFPILLKTTKIIEPERFIRLAKACLTCDTYDRLNEIRCPIFVIGGKEDKIITPEASIEIAVKTGCQIHMYDGLGHSAYEEADDFNQRIYDFLQKES